MSECFIVTYPVLRRQDDSRAIGQGGQNSGCLLKSSTFKLSIDNTLRTSSAKKGTYVASTSTHQPTDQSTDNKKKGTMTAEDKEILVDPNDPDKKL
jgi:hypothetical protein